MEREHGKQIRIVVKDFTKDIAEIIDSKNEQIETLEKKVKELKQQIKNLNIAVVMPCFSDFVKNHKGVAGCPSVIHEEDNAGGNDSYVLMSIVEDYFK